MQKVHRGQSSGDVVDDDVGAEKTTPVETSRNSGWKKTRGGSSEQSRRALPKNLIRALSYRITKTTGSRDLLSQTTMHAGARDEGGTRHEFGQT